MPLLKREVEFSPVGLFGAEVELPWWVAHTRSRQEKALARFLSPLGVPFYVPQGEKRVRRAGRLFTSFLPLFPGYVFFRGTAEQRRLAIQSRLLVGVLDVDDQALLERELRQLHALQTSGANLVPHEELRPGQPVRVTEGPFQGYSGIVVRGQGALRLVVSISMLRKAVAVEFDRGVLSRVSPSGNVRKDSAAVA